MTFRRFRLSVRGMFRRFAPSALLVSGLALGLLAAAIPGWTQGTARMASPSASAAGPASPSLEPRRAALPGPYRAQVLRVVDGDTFEAKIHVWFGQDISTLVRIRGIDAPELKSRCAEEAQKAVAAQDLLADFLRSGAVILSDLSSDKYFGRVVARVELSYGPDFSDEVGALMLAADMARPYGGRTREGWCDMHVARR